MPANPYEMMIANKPYSEVLKAAAMCSNHELDNAAATIPDELFVKLAVYTSTNCRALGIQETLISGCLLSLFAVVVDVDVEGRNELHNNILEDLGVSRTQSFRCRAVWTHFGVVLLREPMLREFFVSESLKILAEERTPDAARQEALELARNGDRISIKVAANLQTKHSVKETALTVSPTRKAEPKTAANQSLPNFWLFSGHVVRVRLEPTHSGEPANLSDVINDLEAAIEKFREVGSTVLMSETTAA